MAAINPDKMITSIGIGSIGLTPFNQVPGEAPRSEFHHYIKHGKTLRRALATNQPLSSVKLKTFFSGTLSKNELEGALCSNPPSRYFELYDEGLMIEALRTNTTLKSLTIAAYMIEQSVDALSEFLERNTSLDTLRICFTYLSDERLTRIIRTLSLNSSLTWINFRTNDLSTEGMTLLRHTISTCPLTYLELNKCLINTSKAIPLFESLQYHPTLQVLDLSINEIGGEALRCLSHSLLTNTTLRMLNLNLCYIDSQALKELSFSSNTTLTSLNLAYNRFNADAAARLINACTGLQSLEISATDAIGSSTTFVQAIETNSNLISLKLCHCFWNVEAEGLSNALSLNSTLQILNLSNFQITHRGMAAIARMLPINTTLTSLDLRDVNDEYNHLLYQQLIPALHRNQSLTFLGYRCLGQDHAKPIIERNISNKRLKAISLYELLIERGILYDIPQASKRPSIKSRIKSVFSRKSS